MSSTEFLAAETDDDRSVIFHKKLPEIQSRRFDWDRQMLARLQFSQHSSPLKDLIYISNIIRIDQFTML